MKAALCLPQYGVPVRAHSLMLQRLALERAHWPQIAVEGIPNLDAVRAALAAQALSEGFDALIWIDADISAPLEAVDRTLELALELDAVAGALYRDRRGSGRYSMVNPVPVASDLAPMGQMFECEAIGFGLTVTPRSAFERIQASPAAVPEQTLSFLPFPVRPYFTSDVRWPELTSDDYAFCRRAREAGVRIVATLERGVAHWGVAPFSL